MDRIVRHGLAGFARIRGGIGVSRLWQKRILAVRPGGSLDGGRCELLELRPNLSLSTSTCLVSISTCAVNVATSCSS
ncbi:MAG: hypothetical protein MJE77_16205, partial [Proteobacteria bacterium]|nr:hypothetical protein [Pseudomonadota bacterium]